MDVVKVLLMVCGRLQGMEEVFETGDVVLVFKRGNGSCINYE